MKLDRIFTAVLALLLAVGVLGGVGTAVAGGITRTVVPLDDTDTDTNYAPAVVLVAPNGEPIDTDNALAVQVVSTVGASAGPSGDTDDPLYVSVQSESAPAEVLHKLFVATDTDTQSLANANISGRDGSGTPVFMRITPGAGVTWRVPQVCIYIAAQSGSPTPYTFGAATALSTGLQIEHATLAGETAGTDLVAELASHLGFGARGAKLQQVTALDWSYCFDLDVVVSGTDRLQIRLDDDLDPRPTGAYNAYGSATVQVVP